MSGKQEPLVSLVAHHVRFLLPRPPAAAARDAKLVPELAPYTKTVFALFQRLRGDRLVPDWWNPSVVSPTSQSIDEMESF